MKRLLPWLPLIIALLLVGATWGQTQSAIDSLDKRLLKAEQMQEAVNKLATGQAAIEERTLNIQADVVEIKDMIKVLRTELWRRRGQVP